MAGGDEDGGADEGGEEGAVDGLPSGTWLGKKRQMPRSLSPISTPCILVLNFTSDSTV